MDSTVSRPIILRNFENFPSILSSITFMRVNSGLSSSLEPIGWFCGGFQVVFQTTPSPSVLLEAGRVGIYLGAALLPSGHIFGSFGTTSASSSGGHKARVDGSSSLNGKTALRALTSSRFLAWTSARAVARQSLSSSWVECCGGTTITGQENALSMFTVRDSLRSLHFLFFFFVSPPCFVPA